MKRLMLYAALLGALSLVLAPAQAEEEKYRGHSVTRDYFMGGTVQGNGISGTLPSVTIGGNTIGGQRIGGARFLAAQDGLGETPVTVTVTAEAGGPVDYLICQDSNADVFCGDPGEPAVTGCGNVAILTDSEVPFDPALDVVVFVGIIHTDCPGGIGNGGLITVEYVVPEEEETT